MNVRIFLRNKNNYFYSLAIDTLKHKRNCVHIYYQNFDMMRQYGVSVAFINKNKKL